MNLNHHFSGPGGCPPSLSLSTPRSRALTFVAIAMLVPLITYWLTWNYEKAGFPVKPRDFTLGMGSLLLLCIALNRPAFCLPSLAPAIFLMARIFDAALLQRYSVAALGGHDAFVMTLVSNLIVALLMILIPSTERGSGTVRWLATAIILGCTVGNLYERMGFGQFTLIPGRMSGFLEDPNTSPIFICLLLGILFTVNPNFWWNVLAIGIGAVGIALTLSRSGMAVFASIVLPYLAVNARAHARGLLILAAIFIPVAGAGLAALAQSARTGVVANDDVAHRLEAIYNLDFEKIKSPERAKDLSDAWEAVEGSIVLGYGTGASLYQWRPHNQIVAIWLDLGVFGVLFYATLVLAPVLISVLKRFRAIFCLMPVLLFIPCSQVLIEMPVYWFAISVAWHSLFPKRIVFCLVSSNRLPPALPSPG